MDNYGGRLAGRQINEVSFTLYSGSRGDSHNMTAHSWPVRSLFVGLWTGLAFVDVGLVFVDDGVSPCLWTLVCEPTDYICSVFADVRVVCLQRCIRKRWSGFCKKKKR